MEAQVNLPGSFCWVELASSDAIAAREFYTDLFAWSAEEDPMDESPPYIRFQMRGLDVAAMYQIEPGQPNAVSDIWGAYISVDDVDAAAARAVELGGSIVTPPFDVMSAGRLAILKDPQGAVFSLWQARDHCGVMIKGEPGSLCWSELLTDDPAGAVTFYSELFGWEAVSADMPDGPYTSFFRSDFPKCGMMTLQVEWGEIVPHWVVYFAVTDCAAAVERSCELGGTLIVPATDVPDVGRFAWLRDPVGAVFGIIQLADADA